MSNNSYLCFGAFLYEEQIAGVLGGDVTVFSLC